MVCIPKSVNCDNISINMALENNISLVNFTTTTRRIVVQVDLEAILMNFIEYRLSKLLTYYGYITEVVVGSVANILVLMIMIGLKHLPICNYMAVLALADLSVLLVSCLHRWLTIEIYDIYSLHTATCRIFTFQSYASFSLSAWLLVAMTVDRYIAITYPLKALRLSTVYRARTITAALIIVIALINCHFFITLVVEEKRSKQERVCVSYAKYRYFVNSVWPWIDATIYSFLPFTFLIVFNFLIIRGYRKSATVHSALQGQRSEETAVASGQVSRRITFTLLTVTFTFIILTAPSAILLIIRPTVFNFKPTPTQTDYKTLAQYMLTASLANFLMHANHCINFFLYVLTGHKFRQQFLNIFMCRKKAWLRCGQVKKDESGSHGTNLTSLRSQKKQTNKTTDFNENVLKCNKNLHILNSNLSTTIEKQLNNGERMSGNHGRLDNQHVYAVNTNFVWNITRRKILSEK